MEEVKQLDKSILDLAMRSFSIKVKNLLCWLLNEGNWVVQKAHNLPLGKRLLGGRQTLPFKFQLGESQVKADGTMLVSKDVGASSCSYEQSKRTLH